MKFTDNGKILQIEFEEKDEFGEKQIMRKEFELLKAKADFNFITIQLYKKVKP